MGTPSHDRVSLPSFSELLLSIVGSPSGGQFSLPQGDSPWGGASGDTSPSIRKIAPNRRKKQKNLSAQGESYRRKKLSRTTIGMLPDNVLLEIFDFGQKKPKFLDGFDPSVPNVWEWHLLVQVCRRWRQIIFASPHRLNLQILCTHGTPVRKTLGIWPAFPIVIDYGSDRNIQFNDEDNFVAALEHPDRVSYLRVNVTGSQLDEIATVMQEPFPALIGLRLYYLHLDHLDDGNATALPAEFLGGSAPCLQFVELHGIPFPALPTLLLSTGDLVSLHLFKIPPTGYISPKAMAACLAVSPRLESIVIEFQSATPRPDQIIPPPVTRTVLPVLIYFRFRGASEYLEDLVAQIDSPQLDKVEIEYLNQLVDFQVAQLSKFIDRSIGPKFTLLKRAGVTFSGNRVFFEMDHHEIHLASLQHPVRISILCQGIDFQLSHIAQVLNDVSVTFSNVVHLMIGSFDIYPEQLVDTDDFGWLHLLHRFTAVQTLHVLSEKISGHVALALEDITGVMPVAAEVLPSLDLIYLSGHPASSIGNFLASRQSSGRPITVVDTKMEFDERLKPYISK